MTPVPAEVHSEPIAISPEEYADRTGLSMSTVRRYLKAGRIPAAQLGGFRCRWLISTAALSTLARDRQTERVASSAGETTTATADSEVDNREPSRLRGPTPRWKQRKQKRQN